VVVTAASDHLRNVAGDRSLRRDHRAHGIACSATADHPKEGQELCLFARFIGIGSLKDAIKNGADRFVEEYPVLRRLEDAKRYIDASFDRVGSQQLIAKS